MYPWPTGDFDNRWTSPSMRDELPWAQWPGDRLYRSPAHGGHGNSGGMENRREKSGDAGQYRNSGGGKTGKTVSGIYRARLTSRYRGIEYTGHQGRLSLRP